ncbi:MAG: rhodanese-like domain-containing protein [Planctomycetota bacterium]
MANHGVDDVDSVVKFLVESDEQERKLSVEPKELAEQLKSPNPPRLLDIRTPDEFGIAKLPGGRLVDQALFHEMMSTWAKDTPIVCYCHVGERSMEAASYLIGHGFTNVKSLVGGIDAWSEQIDPSIPQY